MGRYRIDKLSSLYIWTICVLMRIIEVNILVKNYNVTLNVWHLNESALKFYEKCGMKPLKICMEKIMD